MSLPWRKLLHTTLPALAAAGVLAGGLVLAVLWLEHNSSLELPNPTGPFAVGRVNAVWVDTARVESYAPMPAQNRELVVWLWYPARRSDQFRTAEYLPGPWRRALAAHAGVLLTQFLSRNPERIRVHSSENADVASENATYPVLIFRSGVGALALEYTAIAEDLASHGYIIVAADTPYSTSVVAMPDGRVIHKNTPGNPGDAPISAGEKEQLLEALVGVWTADTNFLLNQVARLNANDPSGRFTGKVDLSSLGVVGHSFGGATAAQFCHDDDRCQAGIDIDGPLYGSMVREGVRQPFLFLLSDHGDAWTSPECQICTNIRSATKRIPDDKLIVTLRGAHHFSFSDQALTKSRIVMTALGTLGIAGDLDARTGLAFTARYVREFSMSIYAEPRVKLSTLRRWYPARGSKRNDTQHCRTPSSTVAEVTRSNKRPS